MPAITAAGSAMAEYSRDMREREKGRERESLTRPPPSFPASCLPVNRKTVWHTRMKAVTPLRTTPLICSAACCAYRLRVHPSRRPSPSTDPPSSRCSGAAAFFFFSPPAAAARARRRPSRRLSPGSLTLSSSPSPRRGRPGRGRRYRRPPQQVCFG